jgi:DNA polymerase-3 subunit beta
MKITVCQSDLDHALRTVAPAIGVRSSHPILDCCLIRATGGIATIVGFNLDLGITCTIPAAVETEGATCLPYRLLAGIVSKLDSDEAITLSDASLTACSGSYGLAAGDAADYPDLPVVDATEAPVELGDAVKACLLAVATDASKQLLTGVHLGDGFMEATDGHRLMRCAVDLPDNLDLVLPAATVRLLQDRSVTVACAAGQAVIDAGDGIAIYSRVLDGAYPQVEKLIPPSFTSTITVNRHRLQRALERVALIAEAHNSVVKLGLVGGTIAITAEADANNGKELLQVEADGKGTWAFNVRYLLDGLKAFRTAETVTLHANTATTPVTLTADTLNAYTYLVMPVQVRG